MRILLVEDNPGDARLIRIKLSEYPDFPFEVSRAETLEATVTELDNSVFDVILLDLNLPDSIGRETYCRVQAHTPDVPIVVLTGFGEEAMGLELVRDGAQDFLVKGQIEGHTLARSLRYAVERSTISSALMAEKDDNELYLDIMSHDIHNLNWAIMTKVEMLMGRTDLPQEVMEYVSSALEQSRAMASLLTMVRIRSTLRGDAPMGEPVDVGTILERAKFLVEHMYLSSGLEIAISMPDGPLDVNGSRWFLDIFVNLVDSSIRFSGKVDPRIDVTCRPSGDGATWRCEFLDNGPGITEEVRERAFDRRLALNGNEMDGGFGLYIVKEVVDRLGGRVWIEDREGADPEKGTSLIVELPLVVGRSR